MYCMSVCFYYMSVCFILIFTTFVVNKRIHKAILYFPLIVQFLG